VFLSTTARVAPRCTRCAAKLAAQLRLQRVLLLVDRLLTRTVRFARPAKRDSASRLDAATHTLSTNANADALRGCPCAVCCSLWGQHRVSLEGIASVGLVIVLALPLLAGTPVPITCAPRCQTTHFRHTRGCFHNKRPTSSAADAPSFALPLPRRVLMEPHWSPAFSAGDVLLSSGKAALHAGAFTMYRDAGTTAALRAGNATTCLGQLLELRCGADGLSACAAAAAAATGAEEEEETGAVAGAAGAPALHAVARRGGSGGAASGAPTHALLRRRARRAGTAGAPPLPCPTDALPPAHALPADADGWECAAVPVQALLGVVGVRVPRAMWPAVPLFALRRTALAARPPRPRLAPHIVAAARDAGWDAWLPGEEASRVVQRSSGGMTAVAVAEAAAQACDAARQEAEAARAAAVAAPFWRRTAAKDAAAKALAALEAPDGACAAAAAAAEAAAAKQPSGAPAASWLPRFW
jgi:hypothetical protein